MTADIFYGGGCRDRVVEEAKRDLQPEDPAYGFINSSLRNRSLLDQFDQIIGEMEIVGSHAHVDSCIDRDPDGLLEVRRDTVEVMKLLHVLPVADDDSFEFHFLT